MISHGNILFRREKPQISVLCDCLQCGARSRITSGSAHVWLILLIAVFALCRVEANLSSSHPTFTDYENKSFNADNGTQCSRVPLNLAGFGSLKSRTDTNELYAFTEIHTHESRQLKQPSMYSHIKVGLIAAGLWSSFAFIMLMLRKKRDIVDVVSPGNISIEALLALPDPVLLWKHNNNCFVLDICNQAAADLWDEGFAELTGIDAREYFASFEELPEGIESAFFSGKAIRREIMVRRHSLSEEKRMECDYIKIDNRHILTILHPITTHDDGESKLPTSTAMLSHLSGNLPVVIFSYRFSPQTAISLCQRLCYKTDRIHTRRFL